jgi:hypothetical protein
MGPELTRFGETIEATLARILFQRVLKAKSARGHRFEKNLLLITSSRVQTRRLVLVEKNCRINSLEGCCIDRLSRHAFSLTWSDSTT